MTKRTRSEDQPKKVGQPKKRVAFSTPKDAGTKAIIVKNASTSPLLQLPLEVRNNIWSEVLGDRLIHVKYRRVDPDPCRSRRRHIVCENDCLGNRPDEEVSQGNPKDIGWLGPHSSCKINYDAFVVKPSSGPSVALWDHKTLHLTVLRTSRQIYVEANQTLWSSNTFSFTDGVGP